MKKRVLVTGFTGFIGSALTSALQREGKCDVVGISRTNNRDLLNPDVLSNISDIGKIVHLAARVGVVQSWEEPGDFYRHNFNPTLNVLEFARRGQIPLVFLSSYVYGSPQYLPIDETHPLVTTNPYAQGKRLAEILCEAYARDFDIPVTILRPFNIYGPNQRDDNLITHLIKQAIRSDEIHVKDLAPKRDYLYIDDLVKALVKILHFDFSGFNIFNIGSGSSSSVQEVIDTLFQVIGRSPKVISAEESRRNEIMDCICDYTKLANQFNWHPDISLFDGLKCVVESER